MTRPHIDSARFTFLESSCGFEIAFDHHLQREVLLRRIRHQAEAKRKTLINANVASPYIAPLFDALEMGDGWLLVYQHDHGQTLHSFLDTNPSLQRRRQIALNILRGLHDLHRKGYFHGNLSDRTVRIGPGGRCYLIDAGYFGRPADAGFGAPEDADPQSVGMAVDLYRFGMLVTRLLPEDRHMWQSCLANEPTQRPTPQLLIRKMDGTVHRKTIRSLIAALTSMIILTGLVLFATFFQKEQHRRWQSWSQNPTPKRVNALRQELGSVDDLQRPLLLNSIAEANRALYPQPFHAQDQDLLAVFAFRVQPELWFKHRIIYLGDWLVWNGQTGYLMAINEDHVVLSGNSGPVAIDYPDSKICNLVLTAQTSVTVFPRMNNLSVLANRYDAEYDLFLADPAQIGLVAGKWQVESHREFLQRLNFDGNQGVVTLISTHGLPGLVGFTPRTVFTWQEQYLPIELSLKGPVFDQPMAFRNINFVSLVDELQLQSTWDGNILILESP